MNAIGGYFELELSRGEHYHKDALRLNSARNCFEYILRAKSYKKVYIPYYTCDVMLETLHKCNVQYEFYHINDMLDPIRKYDLKKNEAFLYTNYYGLKQRTVLSLSETYSQQLIVDNAQDFFAQPLEGIDTFYSARKFVGVADGAYLYTDKLLNEKLIQDISYERMAHLLKRIDLSAQSGYVDFKKNDALLRSNDIKLMSKLTDNILCSIDYKNIADKRIENYNTISKSLSSSNLLQIELCDGAVPMIYPYMTDNLELRGHLIKNSIFIAKYWPNVTEWCNNEDVEYIITTKLLALPIDQRYSKEDMMSIVKLIR